MSSINYICTNTGSGACLVLQTVNTEGNRVDGYVPIITSIILPTLGLASGYPISMTRLDTGLYMHTVQIPSGASALGNYIASVFWMEVDSSNESFGTATLVDGYVIIHPIGGIPQNAIINYSRKVPLGQIGDLSIDSQTTESFRIISSSIYDQSEVNWTWVSGIVPNMGFGESTLVDGYSVISTNIPSSAIITYSRTSAIGQIGELEIGSQTTNGFSITSSSLYDQSEMSWMWANVNNSYIGCGTSTLIDGYSVINITNGLPEGAIITCSRKDSIGISGDLIIEDQSTLGFRISSSSSYDRSTVNWIWFVGGSSIAGARYLPKWEVYTITASRPFGVSYVSPV